jgi:uncharacterized SAM-binding protein YcdF (DUF218 family)
VSYTNRIYSGTTTSASEKLHRVAGGVAAGVALWLLVDLIGVPPIFGISTDAGLIPFALIGGIAALTRFRGMLYTLTIALLALVLVVAYTGVMVEPSRRFIRSDIVPASADAVVALSAGVTPDEYLTREGVDRILSAIALVKRGVAPVLLVTREQRRTGDDIYTTMNDQRRMAALAGVNVLVTLTPSKSTHDEAVRVASVARARHWKRIVLVTSPFHTRRACRTFEKAGLTVSCVPAESRDIAVKRMVYARDRLNAFGMWLYETAGTLRYRQKGWI